MSTLAATIGRGVTGSRPAASEAGRLYYDTTASIWYRDNGSSWDNCTPASLTNPMTTGGDQIYGGASGVPTRLANGSLGQALISQGGTAAPAWTSGPEVLLASSVLGGTAANIDLTAISGAYTHLRLKMLLRCDNAVDDQIMYVKLNNDGGSNYDRAFVDSGGAVNQVFTPAAPGTASFIGYVVGASRTSGVASLFDLEIPFYAQTNFHKMVHCSGGYASPTNGWERLTESYVHYAATTAVSRITIIPNAGNFIAGCAYYLYAIA